MADNDTPAAQPATTPQAPTTGEGRQVLMQKVFIRDASVEVPLAPQIFARQWKPEVDVNMGTETAALGPEQFQVTLRVTVTAKLDNDVAFLVEVKQSALFVLRGFASDAERSAVLGGYCPGLVFPFTREVVANLVQKAGFPELLLQPIDFEALYQEQLRRVRAEAARRVATSNGATNSAATALV